MIGEEGLCAIDASFHQVALHESVGEGEDSIVDVFFDVVGHVLQHHVHVFDVAVLRLSLVHRRLAEQFQQVEGHLPFLFLQRGQDDVVEDLEDSLILRETKQLTDECLIELRNDQYVPLIIIFPLEVFGDLDGGRGTREEVLY